MTDVDVDLLIQSNAASKKALANAEEFSTISPLLRIYLFFLLMFQSIFRLSDNALDILLKFLSTFFKSLGKISSLPESFLQSLPSSLYAARKMSGNERDQFERFVSCPNCHSLYTLKNCTVKLLDGRIQSKQCSFVQFPSHPQSQHRKSCGANLLKKVKSCSNEALSFYPKRVYCYKSLIGSLQDMLKQPDFLKKCGS